MNNKRGRGRPKKSKSSYNNEPKEYTSNNDDKEKTDENIIVFFALSDEESQENNDTQLEEKENDEDDYIDNIEDNNIINFAIEDSPIETITETQSVQTPREPEKKIFTKTQILYNCVQLNKNNKSYNPTNTNIKCWWCDETFDNLPAYIVSNYKNGEYYVFGNFCSFNCAAKYNVVMLKDHKWNSRHALTNNLKNKIMDNNEPLKLAPDRELLVSKGGVLSIEEFREGFDSYGMFPKINMPPMIPLMHVINNNKFL
jgi:hypothetical protein